jgi:uncharacterized protein YjiS (DUF1127 family)
VSTFDLIFERAVVDEAPRGILGRLKEAWNTFQRRRRENATVLELSRMDEHLLRDIGIEPMDVYDALSARRQPILFHPLRRNPD